MAEEWAGIVHTTSIEELEGAEDLTIRGRYFLRKLAKHGGIKKNAVGRGIRWQIEVFEAEPSAYGGGELSFQRLDAYRQMEVDRRGYVVTDKMEEKEYLENQGNEALINRYSSIQPRLSKSLRNKFADTEVWIDGNAAGNQDRLHGIESFMGVGSVAAGDLIAAPDDDYAGQATDIATFGGTWSTDRTTSPNASLATDWPFGKGDSQYDASSPKQINATSTGWGTGATTFQSNGARALRRGRVWSRISGGYEGEPQAVCMGADYYAEFLDYMEAKYRGAVPHKEAEDLGFEGKSVNFEGFTVMPDFGVPAETAYGINFEEVVLECMYKQMFMPKGPTFDINSYSWKFAVGFFGNMRWNPRAHFKIANYA